MELAPSPERGRSSLPGLSGRDAGQRSLRSPRSAVGSRPGDRVLGLRRGNRGFRNWSGRVHSSSAGTVPADQRSATLERAGAPSLTRRGSDGRLRRVDPGPGDGRLRVRRPASRWRSSLLASGAPRCWPSRTASGRRRRLRCLATALPAGGERVLARRPVAFPPTTVERSPSPTSPPGGGRSPVVRFPRGRTLLVVRAAGQFRRGRHRSPWPVLGPEPHSSFTTGRSSRYADQWVPSKTD